MNSSELLNGCVYHCELRRGPSHIGVCYGRKPDGQWWYAVHDLAQGCVIIPAQPAADEQDAKALAEAAAFQHLRTDLHFDWRPSASTNPPW